MAAEVSTIISIILLTSSTTARKVVVLDDNEWDSITVTSSPVKITNSRFNTNSTKNSLNKEPKMLKECAPGDLKCIYDNQLEEAVSSRNPADIQKFIERFSSVTNVKVNEDLKNASSKSYWNQGNPGMHNHPHDDSKGWVTLEPVPWSTSKVSKWRPNSSPSPSSSFGGYGPPQSSNLWVTNGLRPEDNRPTAHWGMSSNEILTDNKPNSFPNYGTHKPAYPPSDVFHHGGYQPPSFPPASYQPAVRPQQLTPYNHYPAENSYPVPTPKPVFVYNNNNKFPDMHNDYHHVPNSPKYPPSFGHPPSYPSEGNGEWVLLSTTKGYSIPERYQDKRYQVINDMISAGSHTTSRYDRSKYAEKDVSDKFMMAAEDHGEDVNRKSGVAVDNKQPLWTVDGINILKTDKSPRREEKSARMEEVDAKQDLYADDGSDNNPPVPITTFKRTVRLTVLPALTNTSTTSHDGLLEVDASTQSVDEEQQQHVERMKKLQQVAVVSTGRKPYRIVPVGKTVGRSQDFNKRRAAVIAAVGAGMVPATMAVLLPLALGRKRRSAPNNNDLIPPMFRQ